MTNFTEPCCISSKYCVCPAGVFLNGIITEFDYSDGTGAKHKCFACGESVCENCSRVVPYYDYGRKRICNECFKENDLKIELYRCSPSSN